MGERTDSDRNSSHGNSAAPSSAPSAPSSGARGNRHHLADENLSRRRRGTRPAAGPDARRPRLCRGRRHARGDARRRASSRSAATSRCSCIRRPARNTRWRAPNARSGRGYRGFVVDADPSVTLEEDLARRDFTINAIAAGRGRHAGRSVRRRARHRSARAAPCRPGLRRGSAARAARGALHGALRRRWASRVAPETMALMRDDGRSPANWPTLVPERVWQELSRALASPTPSAFLRTLRDCGALRRGAAGSRRAVRRAAARRIPSRKSTPACTSNWSATWPRGWRRATT